MILMRSLITEAKVPQISLQQAMDEKLFGPVFHGTRQENLSKIGDEGFKVVSGMYGTRGIAQGYLPSPSYGNTGVPPPVHHLGFGIYFTTKMSIAKKFAGGTTKGLRPYFLRIPKYETINFGSENTMMKWWIKNGFDPELAKQGEGGRYRATVKLTEYLKSQWDAVWYKGKGITTLLDGDQVCVYEPEGKIFAVDLTLSKGLDIGAKVRARHELIHKNQNGEVTETPIPTGTIGIIKNKREADPEMKNAWKTQYPWYWAANVDKYLLTVKWKKGGEQQCTDTDVEPLNQ